MTIFETSEKFPFDTYLYSMEVMTKISPVKFYCGNYSDALVHVRVTDSNTYVNSKSFTRFGEREKILDAVKKAALFPGDYIFDYEKIVAIVNLDKNSLNPDYWTVFPKKELNDGIILVHGADNKFYKMYNRDNESTLMYILRVLQYIDIEIPKQLDLVGTEKTFDFITQLFNLEPIKYMSMGNIFNADFLKYLLAYLSKTQRRDTIEKLPYKNCVELTKLQISQDPKIPLLSSLFRTPEDAMEDHEEGEIYISDIVNTGKVPFTPVKCDVNLDMSIQDVKSAYVFLGQLYIETTTDYNTLDILLNGIAYVIFHKIDSEESETEILG